MQIESGRLMMNKLRCGLINQRNLDSSHAARGLLDMAVMGSNLGIALSC